MKAAKLSYVLVAIPALAIGLSLTAHKRSSANGRLNYTDGKLRVKCSSRHIISDGKRDLKSVACVGDMPIPRLEPTGGRYT